MRQIVQKLFGASASAGVLGGLILFALTGLLMAFPNTAHAEYTGVTAYAHFTFDGTRVDAQGAISLSEDSASTSSSSYTAWQDSPNGQSLSFATPYTDANYGSQGRWSAEMYLGTTGQQANTMYVGFGNSSSDNSFTITSGSTSETLVVWAKVSGTWTNVIEASIPDSAGILDYERRWHHVVIVHDQAALTLYINGVASGTYTLAGRNMSCLQFGSMYNGAPSVLTRWSANTTSCGAIDDFAMFNAALSAAQVQEAYSEFMSTWPQSRSATASALLDPTAEWLDATGAVVTFDPDSSASATVTSKYASLETLQSTAATNGFSTPSLTLKGEALTLSPTSTEPLTFENVTALIIQNDVTIDLSGILDTLLEGTSVGVLTVSELSGTVSYLGMPDGYTLDSSITDGVLTLALTTTADAVGWAVNFTYGGNDSLSGTTEYGLSGYQVAGDCWYNLSRSMGTSAVEVSLSAGSLKLFSSEDGSYQTDPLVSVSGSTYGAWRCSMSSLSYVDTLSNSFVDGSVHLSVNDLLPGDYELVLYYKVENATMSPAKVNGTYYSYDSAGDRTTSTTTPTAGWGTNTNTSSYVEGQNVLVAPVTVLASGDYANTITFEIARSGNLNYIVDGSTYTMDWYVSGIADGLHGFVVQQASPRYTRTLSADSTWELDGAWVCETDGTTVATPPENSRAVLTLTQDVTLTLPSLTALTDVLLKLQQIDVVGDYTLTLLVDASAFTIDAETTISPILAVHDPNEVQVQVKLPSTISVTSTASTAYQESFTVAPRENADSLYTATVSGDVAWADLTWYVGGALASTLPSATDPVVLTLSADSVIDCTGATAASIEVNGYGYSVAFTNRPSALDEATWTFLNQTILSLTSSDETVPTTSAYPTRVRYDYAYSGNLSTTANYEIEFAAGYSGSITPAGGTMLFTAGTVTLGMATNATSTTVILGGTANVTFSSSCSMGTLTLIVEDSATVTTPQLITSNGYSGRTSTVILRDDSTFTVTGSTNGSTSGSLLLGHWAGVSNLTVSDRATLISEQAEMIVGHDATSSTVTIEDDAVVKVYGIATNNNTSGRSSALVLNGGHFLVGDGGFVHHYSSSGYRQIALTMNGGTLGAWQGDQTLGASAGELMKDCTGNLIVYNLDDSALTLTQEAPLIASNATSLTVESGELVLSGSDLTELPSLVVEADGELTVSCTATTPKVTLNGGKMILEGGFLTLDAITASTVSTLQFALREKVTEGGYLIMANSSTVPEFTNITLMLELDADRAETSRLFPQMPLCLGSYTSGETPVYHSVAIQNNSNGAISEVSLEYLTGTSGAGLYAVLTGSEILSSYTWTLNNTTDGLSITQSGVDGGWSYYIFNSTVDGAKLNIPSGGLALAYGTFQGNTITVVAQGTTPHTLLQGSSYMIDTDVTFDLTAWTSALTTMLDGAVQDVPVSICLVSGGISVTGSVQVTSGVTLPNGFTESLVQTSDGLYWVVSADRQTRSVAVNFTESDYPLDTTPATVGAYPLAVRGWNTLEGTFSSSTLQIAEAVTADRKTQATRTVGDSEVATQVVSYATLTGSDSSAITSLLSVWIDSSSEQSVKVTNVPFTNYRVALIFGSSITGAAYAPITINDHVYTMDGDGYTRKDILGYEATNSSGNLTTDIPADTAWGSTDTMALTSTSPVVLGVNALVTEVLSDDSVTITLPESSYGVTYATLAAIQILEAPTAEDVATTAVAYSYDFSSLTADEAVNLADLDLSVLGSTTTSTWVSGALNTLSLTIPEGVTVTLTLPAEFQAATLTATGSGSLVLAVEDGGNVALGALDVGDLTNCTIPFDATGLSYTPAAGVSYFKDLFDNNGSTYTIAEGATLWLDENSGVSTSVENTSDPTLTIDTESAGTLRQDAPIVYTTGFVRCPYLTLAGKSISTTNTGYLLFYPSLLIEEGDAFTSTNCALWFGSKITRTAPQTITQRGGTFISGSSSSANRGMISGGTGSGMTLALNISGGVTTTNTLVAWNSTSHVTAEITGTGILQLGSGCTADSVTYQSLYANVAGETVTVTASDGGTLETYGSTMTANSTGTVTVTIGPDGRLSTTQAETDISVPLTFTGTETNPSVIAPPALNTILLSGASTSSGVISVARGALAVASDSILGSNSVTVASGATFEARGLTDAATGTVTFQAGSTLSATAETTEGSATTFYIADTIAVDGDDWSEVTFLLNDVAYGTDAVTVDTTTGSVTLAADASPATYDAVTWPDELKSGTWQSGLSVSEGSPWVLTSDDTTSAVYRNGAEVTFAYQTTSDPVAVTLSGVVTPGAMTFSGDTNYYTFSAADADSVLNVANLATTASTDGTTSYVSLGGAIYDVPISTGSLTRGALNPGGAYRLVGVLSDDNTTASLWTSGSDLNTDSYGHWYAGGSLTLSPHAGETQILPAGSDQMTGGDTIVVTGQTAEDGTVSGGTVQLVGSMPGTNWNNGFSGTFSIQDGATLDLAMTRADTSADANPFFYPTAWGTGTVFTLDNGATLTFSGANGYIGNIGTLTASAIGNEPIVIGKSSRMEYTFSTREQLIPYGLLMNGEGATIYAGGSGLFMARGASFVVAGTASSDTSTLADTTAGITAYLEGGIARWTSGDTTADGVYFDVGTGSTLEINADLTVPSSTATNTIPFVKKGAGQANLNYGSMTSAVDLIVSEGTLGGTSSLSNTSSAITVEAGAAIEAGLYVTTLTLEPGSTLVLDPTGDLRLRATVANFSTGNYTIESLTTDIPSATGLDPVKVVGWSSSTGISSAKFTLSDALTEAGYAVMTRDDGLYLMQAVTYVRDLRNELSADETTTTLQANWYAATGWYRLDDTTQTKRNYDPADDEAPTALFILPDYYRDTEVALPTVTLNLTQEVVFSNVRFVIEEEDGTQTLAEVEVTYVYDLSNETMPGTDEVTSFTWVPTLYLDSTDATSSRTATIAATVPSGYSYEISDASVVVYSVSATPALNVNFTARTEGDGAWLDSDSDTCGVVPFAGVYWNNASTATSAVSVTDTYSAYQATVTFTGVTDSSTSEQTTASLSFVTTSMPVVSSRQGGGNATLAASYLPGYNGTPDSTILTAANMDSPGVTSGWQVRLGSVPFAQYDLYLLFAGSSDDSVTYPAVRIKIGTDDWMTFGSLNGWTAQVYRTDTWTGTGGLVSGEFVENSNALHLRISTTANSALQIASVDSDSTTSGGLAAFQIVQCDDGAQMERSGSGSWSDSTGWTLTTLDSTTRTAWIDSTTDTPRPAVIGTVTLDVDSAVTVPYLLLNGTSGTTTISGTAGAIETAAVDMRQLGSSSTVNFSVDPFASAPNVVLGSGMTLSLPEEAGTTTEIDWRWIHDLVADSSVTSSNAATLSKTTSGDLVLTRKFLDNLNIEDGTLWLDTTTDGTYTHSGTISGDGTLGKTGSNQLSLSWGNISVTGNTNNGIFVDVDEGTLSLTGTSGSSLPTGGIARASSSGTIVFSGNAVRANFYDGIIRAENGGTVSLYNATNLFETSSHDRNPSVELQDGRLLNTVVSGAHYHIYGLTSSGLSSLYMASNGWNGWDRQSLNLWSGNLSVEEGALALWSNNSGSNNFMWIRGVNSWTTDTGEATAGGEIAVADGAEFYSDYPICFFTVDESTSPDGNKTGTGMWVQTRSLSNQVSQNGSSLNNGDLNIYEGTLRWNLGSNTQSPNTSVSINIYDGARMDGSGALSNTSVVVESGGTLSSGVPKDWDGIDTSHAWYSSLPAAFKGESSSSIGKLQISGNLTLKAGAILEVDLNQDSSTPLDVDGTVSFAGALTVQLTNLPDSLSSEGRQLTDFAAVSGTPTITCPAAVALDAEVVLQDDGNLWLMPAGASYIWTNASGKWSDASWSKDTETGLSYPEAETIASAPVARVQSTNNAVDLTVDASSWMASSLVLVGENATTLSQGATDEALNPLTVGSNLWKIGAGSATVNVPVVWRGSRTAITNGNGTAINVNEGSLTLTKPLVAAATASGSTLSTLATDIEVASGATLAFDWNTDSVTGPTVNGTALDFTTQTLTGSVTGAGTLTFDGTDAGTTPTFILSGTEDSTLNLNITNADVRFTAGTTSTVQTTSTRTATLNTGAILRYTPTNTTQRATGSAQWNWTLADGTAVYLTGSTRVRGRISASAGASATFGSTAASNSAYIDNDLTFWTGAGATLTLGGTWTVPSDVTDEIALTKAGAGTLLINGTYTAQAPLTVNLGTVALAQSVAVNSTSTTSVNSADWTFASGTTLAIQPDGVNVSIDLGGDVLTMEPGSAITSLSTLSTTTFNTPVVLGDGVTIALGVDNGLHGSAALYFRDATAVNGSVVIDLDALDPTTLSTSTTSYTLVSFESASLRTGSGTFRLGGEKLVEWAEAGWTLHDNGTTVTLDLFANGDYYTWANAATDATWSTASSWLKRGAESLSTWDSTAEEPSVYFVDSVTVGSDTVTPNHTVDWDLTTAQTLGSLRCENSLPEDGSTTNDYTLSASGTSTSLTLTGDFVKLGDAALTVSRPVYFSGTSGTLQLLGGTTTFGSTLATVNNSTSAMTMPVTLTSSATLAFSGSTARSISSDIEGDGTGVITSSSTSAVTLSGDISNVASLETTDSSSGFVLSAADQLTIAPTVTLVDSAILRIASTYTTGGTLAAVINPEATSPTGTFRWTGSTSISTSQRVRLGAGEAAVSGTPAFNVASFVYHPSAGSLIIDPNDETLLPSTVKLSLTQSGTETNALLVGADTTNGSALTVGALTGAGTLSVEPVTSSGTWSTSRDLTVALIPDLDQSASTYTGTVFGTSVNGTTIRLGLNIQKASTVTDTPTFYYAGTSSDSATLGTLTAGAGVRTEVTGTWAGSVAVEVDGELAGNGTVGASSNAVSVPAGAYIGGSTMGSRTVSGIATAQIVPGTLTVAGELEMEPGSNLNVLIQNNESDETEVSLVEANALTLPSSVDDEDGEVKINVYVTEDGDAYTTGTKILGWSSINGVTKINGTVYLWDETTSAFVETDEYVLRQKTDGLYLNRTSGRFYMFLR